MNLKNTINKLIVLSLFVFIACSEDEEVAPFQLATINTSNISEISFTSAVAGGDITEDGGVEVTERGVCWSKSELPTTSDNKTSNGDGKGAYQSELTDLEVNTTYYVRAYAINEVGVSYGEQVSFTTGEYQIPAVLLSQVSDVSFTWAIGAGQITANGGAEVTTRGFCWSVNENPTTDDNITIDGNESDTWAATLSGLQPNTTYYVRAYATNVAGTGYSNTVSFTTEAYQLATVATSEVNNILYASASCGGEVTHGGNTDVSERGLCWGTTPNPTIAGDHSSSESGNGSFNTSLTSLQANTTYYVRAYATNEGGTAYGNEVTFKTPFALAATLPVGHFDFNSRTTDLTGSGNHITLNGASYGTDRNGNASSALYFDGVDDSATGSTLFGTTQVNAISVSVWIKTTHGNYSAIKSNEIALTHIDANNALGFTMVSGSTGSAITSVGQNEWHHVVGVYNGSTKTILIYVDGVFKNSYVESGNVRNFGFLMNLTYGTNNGSYWGGYLDDLRYYNYALTQSQILELYSNI